ncbi:major facilitator superfamily domain-containing protein [Aspergillus alliaceus]|uniref:Major facilitator superfamily domain-containing protein n=1 Tax=Petromyces alliaceus TaxID=209559 RepID=A0A5N7C4N0_PETAA|nr:major facilitator superfamily domain-containing protein [Aspergillus alliaceus]
MTATSSRTAWRVHIITYTLALVDFAAVLDSTSLSVALPIITRALNGTSIEAFWVGTSFYLSSTVCQPIISLFSDICGRRFAILSSLVILITGSIFGAVSHNFTVLLLGRCLQGCGAGGVSVMADVILTDIIPLRDRGKWYGLMSVLSTIGYITGPLIGGALAQHASWRWIFWITLPFAGVGLILLTLFLQLEAESISLRCRLSNIDYAGIVLFMSSLTSFLIPLAWGGVIYPWTSWHTLVPLIFGAAGLIAFMTYEHHVARNPFIPPLIYSNVSSAINYLGVFLLGLIMWTLLYYLPLYYEAVKGYSTTVAGLAIFPQTLTIGPVGIGVSIAIAKLGRYRWALWTGWVVCTIGLGLLYPLGVETRIAQWIFLNVPVGLGIAFLLPSIMLGMQASAPPELIPMSVTLFGTFRSLGRGVGVTLGGVIFQNRMKVYVRQIPHLADKAAEYSRDASALVRVIEMVAVQDDRVNLRTAYAKSLADVWVALGSASAVGLIASLFVKGHTMNKGIETRQPLKGARSDDSTEGQVKMKNMISQNEKPESRS